jgi:hypothetical protein
MPHPHYVATRNRRTLQYSHPKVEHHAEKLCVGHIGALSPAVAKVLVCSGGPLGRTQGKEFNNSEKNPLQRPNSSSQSSGSPSNVAATSSNATSSTPLRHAGRSRHVPRKPAGTSSACRELWRPHSSGSLLMRPGSTGQGSIHISEVVVGILSPVAP